MTSRLSRPRLQRTFKVSVDARDLTRDHRGIGRYARAVVRRLARSPQVSLTLLVDAPFARIRLAKTLDTHDFSVRRTIPSDCDVVWHPWNGTFFNGKVPSVATIHDAVPFRFPVADASMREHQQQPFRRSVSCAKRIIAVSRFGAQELMEALNVPATRIDVVYHGVEESFCPGEAQPLPARLIGKNYCLFIGDYTEPRKNFDLLAKAFAQSLARTGDIVLAAVSKEDPKVAGVVHVPVLNDDFRSAVNVQLRALYRGALAVCIPSYYETFGMPMIESMACGTPVLASRASCLPEVGGEAALFVEPFDLMAWADALQLIAHDATLRESLSQKGLTQAQHYRWDECAAKTLAVLERAGADASAGSA